MTASSIALLGLIFLLSTNGTITTTQALLLLALMTTSLSLCPNGNNTNNSTVNLQ